jgi:hypothetical protein
MVLFVAQAPLEGKHRNFIPLYGNTIFQAMPHCAFKLCARQSKCLCIASEISAKLFDFSPAKYLHAFSFPTAPTNVSDSASGASNLRL